MGGMGAEKKRFPWWAVVGAVLLLLLAAALGIIETMGRWGTLVGRVERVKYGMSEMEVVQILGRTSDGQGSTSPAWRDDGVVVVVGFEDSDSVCSIEIFDGVGGLRLRWRIRRWAEQAYTAIHGPRR